MYWRGGFGFAACSSVPPPLSEIGCAYCKVEKLPDSVLNRFEANTVMRPMPSACESPTFTSVYGASRCALFAPT